MKLVFTIINTDDEAKLLDALNANNFRVTRLCSSGGFLKTGNITLMSAVEDQRVNILIDMVKRNCRSRKQILENTNAFLSDMNLDIAFPTSTTTAEISSLSGARIHNHNIDNQYSVEINVGGAIIFVLNVERFVKM